jgi:hypothetical protein
MTMEKIKPLLLLPLLAFLAACGPGATISTATDTPTRAASPTPLQESACQKISLEPTPDAKISSLFPPVGEYDHVVGPKDAPMTIIEYGDFQ